MNWHIERIELTKLCAAHHLSSDNEEEEYEHEQEEPDQIEEGTPLLWDSNSHSRNATTRKTENQYNKWWFSLFFCCT